MHPQEIAIFDYTYDLPEEKIAFFPLPQRDASRLLIYDKAAVEESTYQSLPHYLPENSWLIFNNTKVIEARLLFQKSTGGVIEIFCLAPDKRYPDISTALAQQEKVYWQCLVGGASKWKQGQVLEKIIPTGDTTITLYARYTEKQQDGFIIELSWTPSGFSFADILQQSGAIPLPPYIKRKADTTDTERYQTIFAEHKGSVAAPTAALHFTPELVNQLEEKNIGKSYVTLHVGAGTFKPVKAAQLKNHVMHEEWIDITLATLEEILTNLDKKIVAVGTTSLRTIESLYWLGAKLICSPESATHPLHLSQWEAYEINVNTITAKEALLAILNYLHIQKSNRLIASTQLLIAPGYSFKIIKGLITNFHQPQSTLLLLVAAITGGNWKQLYQYALDNDFRFLSYGDGSLLWLQSSA